MLHPDNNRIRAYLPIDTWTVCHNPILLQRVSPEDYILLLRALQHCFCLSIACHQASCKWRLSSLCVFNLTSLVALLEYLAILFRNTICSDAALAIDIAQYRRRPSGDHRYLATIVTVKHVDTIFIKAECRLISAPGFFLPASNRRFLTFLGRCLLNSFTALIIIDTSLQALRSTHFWFSRQWAVCWH